MFLRLTPKRRSAFTLIELIVVIVILSLLALIAIPTYRKATERAQDEATLATVAAIARSTQALNAMGGGTGGDAWYTYAQESTEDTPAKYAATKSNLAWTKVDGPSTTRISGWVGSATDRITLSLKSPSGNTCYGTALYSVTIDLFCDGVLPSYATAEEHGKHGQRSDAPQAPNAPAPVGEPTNVTPGWSRGVFISYPRGNTTRTVADVKSRLVQQDSAGTPIAGQWLFDATLFAGNIDGTATWLGDMDDGRTQKHQWYYLMDHLLNAGGQVDILDQAIADNADDVTTTGSTLGLENQGGAQVKQKVVIAMPWLDTTGSYDFDPYWEDGVQDPSNPVTAAQISSWYVNEVANRWRDAQAAGRFKNVELWGVYFMREDTTPSEDSWRVAAQNAAHQRGLSTLWIPYRQAPGMKDWWTHGVDVMQTQASYQFTNPYYGGTADETWLATNASVATNLKRDGSRAPTSPMIELGSNMSDPVDAQLSRQALYAASKHRYGPTSWYMGKTGDTSGTSMNADDVMKPTSALYGDIARYLRTGAAPDPDPALERCTSPAAGTYTCSVSTTGPAPTAVNVEYPTTPAWAGSIGVSGVVNGQNVDLGWAAAGGSSDPGASVSGGHVPLGNTARPSQITVKITPSAGYSLPQISSSAISLDAAWPTGPSALPATSPSLVVASAQDTGSQEGVLTIPARYPDTSGNTLGSWGDGLLNDGSTTTGAVGWYGQQSPSRITLDLQQSRSLDTIRVHVREADNGVNLPDRTPLATVSGDVSCVAVSTSRPGALPAGCQPLVLTGTLTGRDAQGAWYDFRSPSGRFDGRYATITLQSFWMLVDEVQALSGGANVAAASQADYMLLARPSYAPWERQGYPTTGSQLVDGLATTPGSGYRTEMMAGTKGGAATYVVDNLKGNSTSALSVWTVNDSATGMVTPKVTVAFSGDCTNYQGAQQAQVQAEGVGYDRHRIVPQGAWRCAKITVTPPSDYPSGWKMVTEIAAS